MGPVECAHEQDVLDAIAAGRWPARCDDALRAHVAACRLCADLAAVAAPLRTAGDQLWEAAHVPSAGTVWWRAQVRARREAAREAARPVAVAGALGYAVALLLLGGLAWLSAPWLAGLTSLLPELPSIDLPALGAVPLPESSDLERWRWVIGAAAAWLIIAPLAIYFALLED